MARYSKTVDAALYLDFRESLSGVPISGVNGQVTVKLQGDGDLRAEPFRLEELLRQAARLVDATNGSTLVVELADDDLIITTDGHQLAPGDEVDLFEYDTAVPNADAGILGPNIRTIARAHGWTVTADEDYSDGIRMRIRDVETRTAPSRTIPTAHARYGCPALGNPNRADAQPP